MVLQMRAKQLNPNAQTKEFTNNSETIYDSILVCLYELLTTHEKGKKLINAVIDDALHQIQKNRKHMIEEQNLQRTEEISQGMFQVRSLIKMLTNCREMKPN